MGTHHPGHTQLVTLFHQLYLAFQYQARNHHASRDLLIRSFNDDVKSVKGQAKVQIKKDKPVFILILSVFVLGLFFTYSQFKGWDQLVNQGFNFAFGTKEVSLLYVLTGAHLAHLFAGLISLLVVTIKAKNNRYNSKNYLGIKLASTYWHFLTILWVYLFLFLKYL